MGIFDWVEKGEQERIRAEKKIGRYKVAEASGLSLKDISSHQSKTEAIAKAKQLSRINPKKDYRIYDVINPEGRGSFYRKFKEGKLKKVV
jgi:hypothetical protein